MLLLGAVSGVQAQTFGYTGSTETFTIPVSGVYQIVALGADGGTGFGPSGGSGAGITGNVFLSAGTLFDLVVGGAGLTGNISEAFGGGGGGGYDLGNGGGGGGGYDFGNGGDGQTGTSG
jgi:hypothetical protein